MSGAACASAAVAGTGAPSRARPGTTARRVRPVVALRQPTRGLSRRGSPNKVRPSLVPRATFGALQQCGGPEEDTPRRASFVSVRPSRGTRAVPHCAPPGDASREVSKQPEEHPPEMGDGDDVPPPDGDEQTAVEGEKSSVDELPRDDPEPTEEPLEEPTPEIKYKPPGVSKRKRSTPGVVTTPVVANPVPPYPSLAANQSDAKAGEAAGEAAPEAGAKSRDESDADEFFVPLSPRTDEIFNSDVSGTETIADQVERREMEKEIIADFVNSAETAALRAMNPAFTEPSAAAREAFKTAKDAFKAASVALESEAKVEKGKNKLATESVGDNAGAAAELREKDTLSFIPADADVKIGDDGIPYLEKDGSLDELEPPGKWPSEKDAVEDAKSEVRAEGGKDSVSTEDETSKNADKDEDSSENTVDDNALLTAISAVVMAEKQAEAKFQSARLQLSPPPLPTDLPAIYAVAEGQGFATVPEKAVSKGMARGIRKPKVDPEKQGIPPSERVPAPKQDPEEDETKELREEVLPKKGDSVKKKKDDGDGKKGDGKKRGEEKDGGGGEDGDDLHKDEKSSVDTAKEETLAAKTKAKAAEMASWTTGVDSASPKAKEEPKAKEPVEAKGGGGGGGDGGGEGGGSGGGGGGGGDDDHDDDDEVSPEDLPVPLRDIALAAWAKVLTQLENILKRVVKLWVTRDPTLTGKLFGFTAMGIVFLGGASFLGPRNPLEFGRDSLFSTVMGVKPQWVLNREQGPVQATFLSCAAACLAAIAKIRLGNNMIPLSPFMHGVLGLPVGFMLVFRWNNAYERWWSGRTELGLLLMHAKNLGGQFCTWVAPDDQQLATRALALLCALKECVADRLNGTVLKDGTVMLNATSLSTPLHPADLEGLFAAENKVLFCIESLRQCIYNASKQGCLPPPVLGGMINEDLFGIMEAYGECEKVVNQPPPGCIITHLKSTLMVYVCTLPFILVHEVGVLAVVPTTALLSLALFGTEAAAEQIEQPFGNRPYHLPVRGLIINNTRDMGQTSRPVLGFAGYVNSPRDFVYAADTGNANTPLNAPGPLLFGSADAWESDNSPVLASPSGVRPEYRDDEDEEKDEFGDDDLYSTPTIIPPPSEKVSLPSRTEDDAGVVEMGGVDGWVGDGLTGWVASAKAEVNSTAAAAAAASAARRKKPTREKTKKGTEPFFPEKAQNNASRAGSWYPGSTGTGPGTTGSGSNTSGTSTPSKTEMPRWKAQTPIEVFEDNETHLDRKSGAEKHRFHVGDSKRRKSIDAAGFRDDTAIPDPQKRMTHGFPSHSLGFPGFPLGGGGEHHGSPAQPLTNSRLTQERVGAGGLAGVVATPASSPRQNPLLRQSSLDSSDLGREPLHGHPNPFHGSPPRSPTRARRPSDNGHRHDEPETPSRPGSPTFGAGVNNSNFGPGGTTFENPDSVRTWNAAESVKIGRPVPRQPQQAPKANSGRPPRNGLTRSQSMSAFADEANVDDVLRPGAAAPGSVAPVSSPSSNRNAKQNGESRPAIWDVFGSEKDRAARR